MTPRLLEADGRLYRVLGGCPRCGGWVDCRSCVICGWDGPVKNPAVEDVPRRGHSNRFSEAQIDAVCAMYAEGKSQEAVADAFHIARTTLRNLLDERGVLR